MYKYLIINTIGGKTLAPESVIVNYAFDQGWIKGRMIDKKCQLSENYFWDANGGAFVV